MAQHLEAQVGLLIERVRVTTKDVLYRQYEVGHPGMMISI